MKRILLTHRVKDASGRKFARVNDEDFGWLSKWHWYFHKNGHKNGNGYAIAHIDGKVVYMHRLILKPKAGLVTDHINNDGLDNRRANLRACTRRDNLLNRQTQRNSRFGYKGVGQVPTSPNRYNARIYVRGRRIQIGTFDTPEEAAKAYNEAAIRYFGEFAFLNPIA